MMKIFKNRKFQIVAGVVVVLLVVGLGYMFIANRSSSKPQDDQTSDEVVVQKLSPDEVGLTMTANPSKKSVKFALAKVSGITSLEYQLIYEADSTAQEQSEGGEARVQRGITGDVTIKPSDSSYASDWLDLGSCSKNVCRYDTGVTSVALTLKIVKEDGKTYEVDKTLDL